MFPQFSGMHIALAGLRSARAQMDVAAQNVGNAANPDFAKRRILSGTSVGGPEGMYLQRVTDEFYENRTRSETILNSKLMTKAGLMSSLEQVVPEPGDNGPSALMNRFFSAVEDVVANPTQVATRQVLVQSAQDASQSFRSVNEGIMRLRRDVVGRVQLLASEVNTEAAKLAELNKTIVSTTGAGVDASALIDQRDKVAVHLASLIGGTVDRGPMQTVNVTITGGTLVAGVNHNELQVTDDGVTVGFEWTGPLFTGPLVGDLGGEAAGYLEFANTDVPLTLSALDTAANALKDQVNALHQTGFGLDGVSGRPLFSGTSAGDITVNPDIIADPSRFAASIDGSKLDTTIANRIANLVDSTTGPLQELRSFVSNLGAKVASVSQSAEIQAGVLGQVEGARNAARGVTIDDEVAAIVQYQRAYEASAKVIQVFDEVMRSLMDVIR